VFLRFGQSSRLNPLRRPHCAELGRQLESSRQFIRDQWLGTPDPSDPRLANGVAPRKFTRMASGLTPLEAACSSPRRGNGQLARISRMVACEGRRTARFRPRRRPFRFYPRFTDRRQGQRHISNALPIPGSRDTTTQFNTPTRISFSAAHSLQQARTAAATIRLNSA
jgi:hypothetical protein